MNRLLVSIFWLLVIVSSGMAQDAGPETEREDYKEYTVMSLGDDPLPDADVIVLFGPPNEFYEAQNFSGDGDWYHSSNGGGYLVRIGESVSNPDAVFYSNRA